MLRSCVFNVWVLNLLFILLQLSLLLVVKTVFSGTVLVP